jgi:hypothetical protein
VSRFTEPKVTLVFTARIPPYNPGEVATFGMTEARRLLGLRVRGLPAARIAQAPAPAPVEPTHAGGGWYVVPGLPGKFKGKAAAVEAIEGERH